MVDSVAALVPKAELEGEMGDPQMGLQARLMSQALRKLTGIVSKSKTCLIFINQIREKIGVMFGNPETTTGGRALKFYSSIRVDIRRIQSIKEGDRVVGSRTRAKVVKNKVAAPFREAEFDIIYGEGVSREGDLLDLGVMKDILEKSGTWISYKGERLGQGRENARVFLKEHADIRGKIEHDLRKALGLVSTNGPTTTNPRSPRRKRKSRRPWPPLPRRKRAPAGSDRLPLDRRTVAYPRAPGPADARKINGVPSTRERKCEALGLASVHLFIPASRAGAAGRSGDCRMAFANTRNYFLT